MSKSLMGKVKKRDDEEMGIPSPPKTCFVNGCKNDSDFLMVKVSSGNGQEIKVASDVMTTSYVQHRPVYIMNNNYIFTGWFSRCNDCLSAGMQRKKAKLREQGEDPNYL
jgi:hypothetical protein